MITTSQAVMSLRPGIEWSMSGGDVKNITWHTPNVEPLTQTEVEAEIVRLAAAAEAAAAGKATARAALLERLGITEDEAALLREAGI